MSHIALFGTSADPPTVGHAFILRWLASRFDHVAVWASDNPFKAHQATLRQRMTMLNLLIQDLQLDLPMPTPRNSDDVCCRIALHPELSHLRTIHTLEVAHQLWPDGQFTLVIGSDLVAQLPRWFQAQRLFQQVALLVIPRPGTRLSPVALEQCRALGAKIAIADLMGLDVSSTHYRHSHNPSDIPATVQAYIQQKQLYPCPLPAKPV